MLVRDREHGGRAGVGAYPLGHLEPAFVRELHAADAEVRSARQVEASRQTKQRHDDDRDDRRPRASLHHPGQHSAGDDAAQQRPEDEELGVVPHPGLQHDHARHDKPQPHRREPGRKRGWKPSVKHVPGDQQREKERRVPDPEPHDVGQEKIEGSLALPVGEGEPTGLDAVAGDPGQVSADAGVVGRPHPGQDRNTDDQGWCEKRQPLDTPIEQRPKKCQGHDRAPCVNVEHGQQPRDQAREDKRPPSLSPAQRHPQDDEEDQGKAEPEQRRALGHQVREHGIEPLEVDVAIEGVLAGQMRHRGEAKMLDVARQVDEAEAAAEQEDEDRDRRARAVAEKSRGRQVDHARKRQSEHGAGRGQGFREGKADRDQVGGEEIDHERVAEAVAGVDRKLGREVVAVRERAGKAEVRGPVPPDVDVAGVKPARRVHVGLMQEVGGPGTADQEHREQWPGMAGARPPRRPTPSRVAPIAGHLVASHKDAGAAHQQRDAEPEQRGDGIDIARHQSRHERRDRQRRGADHDAEDDPLLERECDPGQVGDAESRRRGGGEVCGCDQFQQKSCGCDGGRFGLQLTSHSFGPQGGVPSLSAYAETEMGKAVQSG